MRYFEKEAGVLSKAKYKIGTVVEKFLKPKVHIEPDLAEKLKGHPLLARRVTRSGPGGTSISYSTLDKIRANLVKKLGYKGDYGTPATERIARVTGIPSSSMAIKKVRQPGRSLYQNILDRLA